MHDDALTWPLIDQGDATDYRVFQVRRQRARSPRTDEVRTFSVIDCPDWINVIALSPANDVLLVRQFRHGTQSVTLEIPGGMIDPGEAPEQAARRELREETGCEATTWLELGVVEPNPALQNNRCHTWLALDAVPVGDLIQDAGEHLAVDRAPLATIPELIRGGAITHSLVVAAFFHLIERAGGWRRP